MFLKNTRNWVTKFLNTYKAQIRFVLVATVSCIGIAIVSEFIINKFISRSSFYFSWVRFISIAIICLVAILLLKFRQYFLKRLEYAFLIISISMGTLFILVLPKTVYVSPDDQIHLQRAISLLNSSDVQWSKAFRMLELLSTNIDSLSFAEIDDVYNQLNLAHDNTKDQTANFGDNSLEFSRLAYLPYFIGFKISSFLHLSFTNMIIVAKLCNLLCYILILFFAIKISTHAKKIFFVLSLLLSNIFYASQFSCDPGITASIMLAIAIFLRMLEMQYIPSRYIFIFALAVAWASLPKAIYCLILLLLLFVPNKNFGSRRRAIACKTTTVSLMMILAATFVLPMISGGMGGDFRGGDTSVSRQILYILHNPLHFIATFAKFTIYNLPGLFVSQLTSVGFYLPARYTQYISPIINLAYIILLGYITFTGSKPSKTYTWKIRAVILIMFLLTTYSIVGALYLSYSPVGSSTIEGVQDRYFLPILPLAMIILTPTTSLMAQKRRDNPSFAIIAVPFLALALFLVCFILRVSVI